MGVAVATGLAPAGGGGVVPAAGFPALCSAICCCICSGVNSVYSVSIRGRFGTLPPFLLFSYAIRSSYGMPSIPKISISNVSRPGNAFGTLR